MVKPRYRPCKKEAKNCRKLPKKVTKSNKGKKFVKLLLVVEEKAIPVFQSESIKNSFNFDNKDHLHIDFRKENRKGKIKALKLTKFKKRY